jgi:hypothetical protein
MYSSTEGLNHHEAGCNPSNAVMRRKRRLSLVTSIPFEAQYLKIFFCVSVSFSTLYPIGIPERAVLISVEHVDMYADRRIVSERFFHQPFHAFQSSAVLRTFQAGIDFVPGRIFESLKEFFESLKELFEGLKELFESL